MLITVLGISGSPHRHGNTETLLDSFLDGAKEAGAGVEKVILKDLDYSPCRGCNACHKSGDCVMKDDAIALFEKVLKCDCLAIASPIYTMGFTSRMFSLITIGSRASLGKVVILFTSRLTRSKASSELTSEVKTTRTEALPSSAVAVM